MNLMRTAALLNLLTCSIWAQTSATATNGVFTATIDLRYGEHTLRLINISRAEPDPMLFQVPPGYRIVDEEGSFKIESQPEIAAFGAQVDHPVGIADHIQVGTPTWGRGSTVHAQTTLGTA